MINLNLTALNEYKQKKLDELTEYAGSPTHLSRMLGVGKGVTDAWVRRGQISRHGARLVEKHPTLGEVFTAKKLRPDL